MARATKTLSHREQLTSQIAAAERGRERRMRLLIVGAVLLCVIVMAAAVVLAAVTSTRSAGPSAEGHLSLEDSQGLAAQVEAINQIGPGLIRTGPLRVPSEGLLTDEDGRLEVVYVGTDYCPYCAGLRWSVADAMSRFGRWEAPLEITTSASAPSVFPDTSTISFSGAALDSEHVAFYGYETAGRERAGTGYVAKDVLSPEHAALEERLNAAPYTPSERGGVPFISIGGQRLVHGALFDTQILEGMSHAQIVEAMKDPDSPVAQAIVGGGNVVTAAVCEIYSGPADVCGLPGVMQASMSIRDQ